MRLWPPPAAAEPSAGDGRVRLGRRAEEWAARLLERRGFAILDRRYRTRAGEIDLVARDGGTIVFIEVKARGSTRCGLPAEAVNHRKRLRMARVAAHYLARTGSTETPCRFDVVEVILTAAGRPTARIIRDAFQLS
jgi:putative endonuclease